ncbi:putative signal transducing protein [Marivita geojedonensis]|nr:putative signal transducing protein [Marivita geojedonensis]
MVMEELLRTNDITLIPLARAVLEDEGIDSFELDVNMSILEGSIGILPRRLMVRSDEIDDARRVLREYGVRFED